MAPTVVSAVRPEKSTVPLPMMPSSALPPLAVSSKRTVPPSRLMMRESAADALLRNRIELPLRMFTVPAEALALKMMKALG